MDLTSSHEGGNIIDERVPEFCENTLVKIMKLMKDMAGDLVYSELYRQSISGEEVKASYES